tara:strand:+ start:1831 stop:2193 length:363 start_codon:yes stop_codon:yes gene_type:complete
MSSVNTTNFNVDLTVRVFDDFYGFKITVPVNEYDSVFGYFSSIYTTKTAALNFTTAIFRIATQQGIPAISLVEQLKTSTGAAELDLTIAYYLNSLRSNSTLLGVSVPVQPNFYASRNARI